MPRRAVRLIVALVATISGGCNVSKSSTAPTSPSAQPRVSRTKFLAFGDSLTSGEVTVPISTSAGRGFPNLALVVLPAASYPSQLSSQLKSRYASQASAIAVINGGLSGEWAQDGVRRFPGAATSADADALLLLEGYNDIGAQGLAGVTPTTRALELMVVDARNRGMRVFLATLPPSRPGGLRTVPIASVTSMNASIQLLASTQGAVLVDLFSVLSADITRYIGSDGLHPTEAGYQRMAEVFFAVIRSDLEIR